jgi:hypothetical protein
MKISELSEKLKTLPADAEITGLRVFRDEPDAQKPLQECTLTVFYVSGNDSRSKRATIPYTVPTRLEESQKPLKHRPFAALRTN